MCQGEYAIPQESGVLNYFDITQNICIQSWTITQIRFKKSELLTYLFIYYQVFVKTPLHNTWLMFESHEDVRWDTLLLVLQKSSLGFQVLY